MSRSNHWVQLYAAFALIPQGCYSSPEGCAVLSEDYRFWVTSAEERFLTSSDDVYLLGPRIQRLALVEGYILGYNPKSLYRGLENREGFFLFGHGQRLDGMTFEELERIAKNRGIRITLDDFSDAIVVYDEKKKHHDCTSGGP